MHHLPSWNGRGGDAFMGRKQCTQETFSMPQLPHKCWWFNLISSFLIFFPLCYFCNLQDLCWHMELILFLFFYFHVFFWSFAYFDFIYGSKVNLKIIIKPSQIELTIIGDHNDLVIFKTCICILNKTKCASVAVMTTVANNKMNIILEIQMSSFPLCFPTPDPD